MEKFALFRLLDALTGLAAPQESAGAQDSQESAAPPARDPQESAAPPAQGGAQGAGVFTEEQRRRRAEQLLARHEAISRRIDRRTKP